MKKLLLSLSLISLLTNQAIATSETEPKEVQNAQYATPTNLNIRQLFNQFPRQGFDVWKSLVSAIESHGLLKTQGDTLEVGCGSAFFWQQEAAQGLVNKLTTSDQKLYLTDFSQGMVDSCKKIDIVDKPGVIIEQADVTKLSYKDRSMARVFSYFMLYECKTEENVKKAVAEISRVLKDDGTAVIVTMDEKVHLIELFELCQRAKDSLISKGIQVPVEMPKRSSLLQAFCAGNAQKYLEERFEKVEQINLDNKLLVTPLHPKVDQSGPDLIVEYLKSLESIQTALIDGKLPLEFFEEIRSIAASEIAKNGEFPISRREVIYLCSSPKHI